MRSLLATALCLCTLTQSPKQHTDSKQGTQAQTNKAATNQSVPDTSKSSETQFYTYNNQKPERNETAKEIGDYLLALFTLALAVVSIMQWLVLRQHEQWMEKHDAKLERVAQAANENAKALINSERAWITVYLKWSEPGNHARTLPDGRARMDIQCICANRGKSPAWVVEQCIKVEVANGFYGPDYSDVHDSDIDRRFIPLSPRDTPTSDTTDFRRQLFTKGPAPINKFILIYGYVKYRDVFTQQGQPRETQFGFFTQATGGVEPISRIAQPEYNRYT